MRFPPYPAYKPSGVAWLGDIPAHWEVKCFKFTVHGCQNGLWGDEPTGNEDDLICIRVADFDRTRSRVNDTALTMRSIPASQRRGREIRSGDLLLEKSGGGELQPVGKVVLYDLPYRAVSSNFVARMRPLQNYDARFLTYLHDAAYAGRLNVFSIKQNTGIQNLDSSSYLHEQAGFPPLPEQCAIAAFLDRETARLDALIAKKERLIELLQEKRTALISHAVTRGLDENVPMRSSGVRWLAQVPTHWQLFHLRRVVRRFVDYRGATPDKVSDGLPLITARNIKNGKVDFDLSREYIREEDYAGWMVRGFPEVGDVLVTTEAPLGETAQIVDTKIALAQRVILLKAEKALVTNDYLRQYLASVSGQSELWSRATGSTAIGIKAYHLKETLVAVPPIKEQHAIAAYLDGETTKIDALVAKVRQAVETLREYRTALISAAVTGTIDVGSPMNSNHGGTL